MERQSLNMEKMYQELFKKYHDMRKLNIELLEEKRELLLRSQDKRFTSDTGGDYGTGTCKQTKEKFLDLKDLEELDEGMNSSNESNTESSCVCRSSRCFEEVVRVNHQWQEKFEDLLNEREQVNARFKKFHTEVEQEKSENHRLRTLVDKLTEDLQNVSPTMYDHKTRRASADQACYTSDDVEALKQQLIAYEEDFQNERKDKTTAQDESKMLQEKLQTANERIRKLSDESRRYKQCFGEVYQQKEHLISELRRLSTSSLPFSPVHQLPKTTPLSPTRRSRVSAEKRPANLVSVLIDDVIIPRSSSFSSSQEPDIVRAPPGAFMGTRAHNDNANHI
eukprot:gene12999-14338_t